MNLEDEKPEKPWQAWGSLGHEYVKVQVSRNCEVEKRYPGGRWRNWFTGKRSRFKKQPALAEQLSLVNDGPQSKAPQTNTLGSKASLWKPSCRVVPSLGFAPDACLSPQALCEAHYGVWLKESLLHAAAYGTQHSHAQMRKQKLGVK